MFTNRTVADPQFASSCVREEKDSQSDQMASRNTQNDVSPNAVPKYAKDVMSSAQVLLILGRPRDSISSFPGAILSARMRSIQRHVNDVS